MSNFENSVDLARTAPVGVGDVKALINRPCEGIHVPVDSLYFDPEFGIRGDRWKETAWIKRPDGSPDPRVQVSLTNHDVIACFTGSEPNAVFRCGDNIYTDLNLTQDALPEGSLIQIGEAVVQVSDVINDACGKFVQRFGVEAFRFIREPKNAPLRLRGIFCQIIEPGWVRIGDMLRVH